MSISSIDLLREIRTEAWCQFCAYIRVWTMRGGNGLQNGSSMRHSLLNVDLEATMETSTSNTFQAILDNIWYLFEMFFHYSNMSKFTTFLPSHFSAIYFSISLLHNLHPSNCSTSKKCLYWESTIVYGSTCVPSLPIGTCTFGELTEE